MLRTHARNLYIGTTAERTTLATLLTTDGIGAVFYDITTGFPTFWDGTTWLEYIISDKTQTLSNKTLISPIVDILKPASDGVTAVQFTKADGTTPVLVLDTLNGRIGININPTECLHILCTTSPLFESTVSSGWSTIVYMDGVGGGGQIVLQRAGGDRESPTAVLSGMTLGAFSFRGHNGTGFTGSKCYIVSNATEDWTLTENGSNIQFRTTANGSTTLTNRLTIGADGSITVGSVASTISLFNVIGSQDRIQAIIRGYSTQTNNLQEWQNSSSTIVGSVSNVGLLSLGIATDAAPRLTIYGGRYGTDMLTLVRTEGATQTFGFALNGGGLSFHDVTHSVYPFTLLGSSTISTVILGQNGKLAGSPIIGILRGENLASGWATNIAAAELRIIGVVGTGSGAGGDIVFQTGNSGASGTTAHSITTKLTIKGTTGELVLAEGVHISPGTTTGTNFGTATNQKIGFWNVTPIIQPSGAAQVAPAAYATGAFGLDSDANMQALYDLVVAMRTALVNVGLMKGAA